jgi:hypothetical protein
VSRTSPIKQLKLGVVSDHAVFPLGS